MFRMICSTDWTRLEVYKFGPAIIWASINLRQIPHRILRRGSSHPNFPTASSAVDTDHRSATFASPLIISSPSWQSSEASSLADPWPIAPSAREKSIKRDINPTHFQQLSANGSVLLVLV